MCGRAKSALKSSRKPTHRVSNPIPASSPRRSARLQQQPGATTLILKATEHQLPSPSLSEFRKERRGLKRKQPDFPEVVDSQKRSRIRDIKEPPEDRQDDPVTHWVVNDCWPESFGQDAMAMIQKSASKQTSQDSSSKRKTVSTHRSDRLERLADNGVFMRSSALAQKSSKELCTTYLRGNRTPTCWPSYLLEKIPAILERIDVFNEGRIQRDVTPWVVPSAENLFFCGEPINDWIGDEIGAEWSRCATMGTTRPKPDYTAGLQRKAFTKDEIQILRNYASPLRPFLFTPELSFPFLVCEAKSGNEALIKAHQQNIHSASIAVRAIIELYKAAFGKTDPDRVDELYGQVLVFTVSHNQNIAHLYGHYAVVAEDSPEKLEFYRYEIALFSLSSNEGKDRYKTYNFVRNVYEEFAPKHRERIKEAIACLKAPDKRTGISFATSSLELGESDSQADSQDTPSRDDAVFQVPGEPASAAQKKQLSQIKTQMNQQKRANDKLQQEKDTLQEEMKRLVQQQQEKLEQQQERMEQQRKQEREEMKQQMEQQREQMEQQREQMEQLLSILKAKS
ncbi:MAG: hypothetical protein MMC23_001801 [Stictis urceolatum]|nr:hypothetical protein [Stictis urceolata]